MVQRSGKVLNGSTGFGPTGVRPSVQVLLESIDRDDPAFLHVATELRRALAGAEGVPSKALIAAAVQAGRACHAEELRVARIPKSIVYYIRRGPLIKIGTTTRPRQRFGDLLPDEILAWEPGGREEESKRHAQFAPLQVRRGVEYFRSGDALTEHIRAVRSVHGGPDPEWPTLQNIERRARKRVAPTSAASAELVTIANGASRLGIRYNTAVVWVHRGKLKPAASGPEGKPLYLLDHMASLARRGKAGAACQE